MQVFVVGLWSPESFRVTCPETEIGDRVVADIQPGAEYGIVYMTVFIQTPAQQEAETCRFPFILQVDAIYVYFLIDFPVVAEHFVIQFIVREFNPGGQHGGHEQEFVEVIGILCSTHDGKVLSLPVGVRVATGTVIGFPCDVL